MALLLEKAGAKDAELISQRLLQVDAESARASFKQRLAQLSLKTVDPGLFSNAFALGADVGGFGFTAALPLAAVRGQVGYDYAEFDVVENNGNYEVVMNNPHIEYIDLAKQKRELRFSCDYKTALGDWTNAGVGFIYRVNPNNTDAFGNESIFMFKLHHRLGI